MGRRRKVQRRAVESDPKYSSELVGRLVNRLMKVGKKSVATNIVYDALKVIQEKHVDADPLEVLLRAIDNVKPRVEVKSRRVGGATYQVPVEVSSDRQAALAMRWLIQYAKTRKGVPMRRALAMEILDAYAEQGNAIKKRDDTHKMAQANKAFAHYRW
jgi:small subunit ribosomal protein S7